MRLWQTSSGRQVLFPFCRVFLALCDVSVQRELSWGHRVSMNLGLGDPVKQVALAVLAFALAFSTAEAHAQTFNVLHELTGCLDGSLPEGALVRDAAGNLFGMTFAGGGVSEGVVFKIGSVGTEKVLFAFNVTVSGGFPASPLTQDASGNLYGVADGGPGGAGVVFRVSQQGEQSLLTQLPGETGSQPKVPSGGLYTVQHRFTGKDGTTPNGALVADSAGNLYGSTQIRGVNGLGTVFKLSPTGRVKVLHAFTGDLDGASPSAGVIQDAAGNVYGTAVKNFLLNQRDGVVFQIAP